MWGQEPLPLCVNYLLGIIPTRVGTRSAKFNAKRNVEDHPHACGDKIHEMTIADYEAGSSPRVWGQGSNITKLFV